MLLWTIQDAVRLDELLRTGVLNTTAVDQEIYFMPALEWMTEKLAAQVERPSANAVYPLWAWQYFDGKGQAKPDLNRTGLGEPGHEMVLLEFEIEDAHVLLSDFMLWNIPMQAGFLARTFDEIVQREEEFRSRFGSMDAAVDDVDCGAIIRKSWEIVFDLELADEDLTSIDPADKSIQAVFWELRTENLRSVERFVAK